MHQVAFLQDYSICPKCVYTSHSTEEEDVVNAIAFLLSDQSAMINCVTLPVDGGFLAC